jgi:hypothetical protein
MKNQLMNLWFWRTAEGRVDHVPTGLNLNGQFKDRPSISQ